MVLSLLHFFILHSFTPSLLHCALSTVHCPLLSSLSMTDSSRPPVFLLDAMSFIFRAYHAMQRSRPMSTRSGLPTAATYVFVNMIKKLRQDFSPKYFAAVFDVSGEVFRDERARIHRHSAPLEREDAELRRSELRRIQSQARSHA